MFKTKPTILLALSMMKGGQTAGGSTSFSQRRYAASVHTKRLWIIRHGQATHNPRAEKAKSEGCSHDEFMELMRQDDSLDAELTEWGQMQATQLNEHLHSTISGIFQKVQLVVSSPLSRAIHTADLALPSAHMGAASPLVGEANNKNHRRVCVEHFREINGWLLNAQRRNITDLSQRFPAWEMTELEHHDDVLWKPHVLEDTQDCAQRGYEGLCWLTERPERNIALVTHGGILRFTMNDHAHVRVMDGRRANDLTSISADGDNHDVNSNTESAQDERSVHARFDNCEMRHYLLSWTTDSEDGIVSDGSLEQQSGSSFTSSGKKIITLTEIHPNQEISGIGADGINNDQCEEKENSVM
jgi:broad specificity phosphatase PhoE